jgi:hypothetical protein
MGIGAIKAFHGSPHKFDKFDMSKIGSGEGAQAYGHGLYFADNPKVAMDYKNKLSGYGSAKTVLGKNNGDIDAAINDAANKVSHYTKMVMDGGPNAQRASSFLSITEKQLKDLQSIKAGVPEDAGHLYEVSLRHPDPVKEASTPLSPSDFLHYGEPVPEALRQSVSKSMLDKFGSGASMGTGEQLYRQIVDEFKFAKHPDPNNAAIKWMSEQGIPGIRYLDGGSRDAGQGTFNYVVFDDRIPKIVNRNGK